MESPRTSTSRRLPPFRAPRRRKHARVRRGRVVASVPEAEPRASAAWPSTSRVVEGARVGAAHSLRNPTCWWRTPVPTRWSASGSVTSNSPTSTPGLVYCAISGYGYDAPDRPAMDNIVQAASGVMAKTGFRRRPTGARRHHRSPITRAQRSPRSGFFAALRQRDATGRRAARRRCHARRAHRVGVGRARRSLRRDRHAAPNRERRRSRRADQHLPVRRRLDRRDVHE